MKFLKKHWPIAVSALACVACLGLFVYRCNHKASPMGGAVPVEEIDWTMIGSLIGAVLAAIVGAWKTWTMRKPVEPLSLKPAIDDGVPVEPNVMRLAQSIAVLQGDVLPNEAQMKLAKDLLEKYQILVRP